MARQIIKQPNGLWASFSSISDSFCVWNATKEEIIEESVRKVTEEERVRMENLFDKLESGKNPYYQFQKTWEECLKFHNRNVPEEYRI